MCIHEHVEFSILYGDKIVIHLTLHNILLKTQLKLNIAGDFYRSKFILDVHLFQLLQNVLMSQPRFM